MAGRINARLDAQLALKMERIRELTGKNTSAILKAAIDRYYESLQAGAANPGEALRRSGFIGSGKGDPDLSSNYKRALTSSLSRKT